MPSLMPPRRGRLFVVAAASGTGKTSLVRELTKRVTGLGFSVSHTTRPRRPNEVDGRDYHFVDRKKFFEMKAGGELLEWARVFGKFYGTPRKPVEQAIASGRDVLFDIDWQGTQQLRERARSDLVSVFLLPPSIPELEKRLHSRGRDQRSVIRERMSEASEEMSHWAEYDYIVINDKLERAYAEVRAILFAERLKRERQPGLSSFVRKLQADLRHS